MRVHVMKEPHPATDRHTEHYISACYDSVSSFTLVA